MSRRLSSVAALFAVLVSGCGGTAAVETTVTHPTAQFVEAGLTAPQGCYLIVFVADEATPPQVEHVRELLLGSPRVKEVSYVSKRLALRRLAQTRPDLVRDFGKHNPLPAQFEVVPATKQDVYELITAFARGVPGVINVRATSACGHVKSLIPGG